MLRQGQSIIYTKNGESLSTLNPDNVKTLKEDMAVYIRFDQPFTVKGCPLAIPKGDSQKIEGTLRTSQVKEDPVRDGNRLICETISGTKYIIEYQNIDLERILQDGKTKGVNQWVNYPDEVPNFPYPGEVLEQESEEKKD
ncbi:hypothetical protein KY331_00915 [Candidatus Woesearchaeota archaeon]|nr:hypothetical protein [Candidatus Woesearchaeota archaeon]